MPKTIKKRIWWTPVGQDVAKYRVYVAPKPEAFSYDKTFLEIPAGQSEVIAPDAFPPGTFDLDTDYSVWITSVDDLGNESDPLALSAPFDFVPPPAPSDGGVEDY